ncbi:MAG: glycosyltransferase family 4 protein, partial [Anaerolineales bacterium]|nr:glycosyltransferase family 4 protein [Anaerolineales bacterium]
MRLLTIIHEYPPIGGGGGAAARDICLGLARRGHEINVLTAHLHGLPQYEEQDGIEIHRLPSLRRKAYAASLLEMAAFDLAGLWAGSRIIKSFRPDVLHAHFAVPAGALTYALARLHRTPYVLTTHLGDVPGGVPEKTDAWFRLVGRFVKPIWHNAARVVAVSNFTRDLALKKYNVPIDVIPNGVDL